MWKDILKVDEFTNEGNSKGHYDSEFDKIKINLDKFSSRSELFDDTDRIKEFATVVAHENAHKEYDKIIGTEMRKALDDVLEETKKYSKIPHGNFEERRNKIKTIKPLLYGYLNYAIVNEKFAFTTGGPDMTAGSMRSVLNQISKKINTILNGKKDTYISKLQREIYEEVIKTTKKEE